jgi:hypothetical protein
MSKDNKKSDFKVSIRIDRDVWTKFKDLCNENDTNASEYLVNFIESELKRVEDDTPKPTEPPKQLAPTMTPTQYMYWLEERLSNLEKLSDERHEFYHDKIIGEFGKWMGKLIRTVNTHSDEIKEIKAHLSNLFTSRRS